MNDQNKTIIELCKSVGRIEGQLEGINTELRRQNEAMIKTLSEMDERLSRLEQTYSSLQGRISVWAGIAGFIGSILLISAKWFLERF